MLESRQQIARFQIRISIMGIFNFTTPAKKSVCLVE